MAPPPLTLKLSHNRRFKTTNAVEHDSAEVRRSTRVVGILPNGTSLVRLTTALAVKRNEQWLERCYLPMQCYTIKGIEMLSHSA